jgi:hypothetical protein
VIEDDHIITEQNPTSAHAIVKLIAELQERIHAVLDYLSGFTREDFATAETQKITQPRWEGKYLTGLEFAIEHAIPNVYFHVTTAYSILRHNGVEIGKKDYLGAMPYKS